MSEVIVAGCGVVSPAGWGMDAFRAALLAGEPLPVRELVRPGCAQLLRVRTVPPPGVRPAFLGHNRLRRTSPITHYAAWAAIEALGKPAPGVWRGRRLGLVLCVTCGCVNYSRRFYSEALKDPATASPLVFPETVFNAPASHICSVLECEGPAYTLVGDHGTFAQGMALAATWLEEADLEGCLVVGADEMDWLVAYGIGLLDQRLTLGEGAGAVFLTRGDANSRGLARLTVITSPRLYLGSEGKLAAVRRVRGEVGEVEKGTLLSDGLQSAPRTDHEEAAVWGDWPGPRVSVRRLFGEGLMAAAAWQCLAGIEGIVRGAAGAVVSLVGSDEQAVAVRFERGGYR